MAWRLGLLALCALLLLGGCQKPKDSPTLEMICLDVGQGSATLLRTGEGDVLIDAGCESRQDELCRKLRALGVERLALLILTHPDEDHIGGADVILDNFEIDAVWTNGASAENDSYERFVQAIAEAEIALKTVRAGDGITIGEMHLSVLSPRSELSGEENEDSLVLLLRCKSFGALLMGDVGEASEEAILEAYGAHLDVDVLCVGHHGANTSTGRAFLEAASPEYAVISCGAGNSYGHPDGRMLARLQDAEVEVCRTDLEGDIAFSVFENVFERTN